MPALGSTTVNLRAETAQFRRQLYRARNQLRSFGREAQRAAKNAALVFTGLAFGGGALGATIKNLANSATALKELSLATGVAVPRLQELQRVFESDGVSAEAFNKSIKRLQRSIGDAAGGELEYLESFQELGVNLRDAQGEIRTTDSILTEVIPKLAALPRALQASFGADLFGRGFQDIQTFLSRMGEDIEAFNTELQRQQALLPSLTDQTATNLKAVSQAFTDAGNAAETYGQILVASIGPEIVAGIEGALRTLRENAGEITAVFRHLATNFDTIAKLGIAFLFRRIAFSVGLATYNLIVFAKNGVVALLSGKANIARLAAQFRQVSKSALALGKNLAKATAGILAIVFAVRYFQQIARGEGFNPLEAFAQVIADVVNTVSGVADLFGEIKIPTIEIDLNEPDPVPVIKDINDSINNAKVDPIVIGVEVEDFGLKDQLQQLEQQRNLLLTTGDATVELAARQSYLSRINQEIAKTYDELNNALNQLARGGDELTDSKTTELETQVDSLNQRIKDLNAQAISPTINQSFFDDIVRVNNEIAKLEGERSARVAIDVDFELGGSLDVARAELEAEIALLQRVGDGDFSFGVAEVMAEEVRSAIGELDSLNARIAENERLLDLKPDIREAARLNAELKLLRERAQNIELMVVDPTNIQAASEEIVGLQNQLESYRRTQQFASSVANSFASSLGGIIKGSKSGSDAVKSFILSLADLVLQYTVLIPLAQSLSLALGASLGGGIFGGIAGAATGGYHSGLTLVGERGPELVDLGSGSRVYTNDQLADAVAGGGGGSTIVNNNISIDSTDGPGVRRALAEALPAITDASVNRIMNESTRPGQVRTVLRGY